MAIQLFGANLDDYLHLLLPPVVKLLITSSTANYKLLKAEEIISN